MFSTGFASFRVFLLFPYLSQASFFFYTVFVAISQMPNEARSVFGDYNLPHKDWLTYINKTDRTSELCYNLSISHQGFIQTILMSVNTKNLIF